MDSSGHQKQCFVLMPFTKRLNEVYTDVYKMVCEQNDLRCWRVDEISRPGSISRDIVEGILDADVVIADLTCRNPNVFYELGIAHATGNKTIMTCQSLKDVPFDIQSYRVIIYEHSLRGCEKLKIDLDSATKELLQAIDRTNNPFQDVVSSRSSRSVPRRVPITASCNFSQLPEKVRLWLIDQQIRFSEDFTNEQLERLNSTPGIGKSAMAKLCTALMEGQAFPDLEYLHEFVLKNAPDVSGNRSYY